MNYFEELNQIDVSGKAEKKNNLTYLSWAWAWAELKKKHPLANYRVYENERGWNYFTDGRTCWVKVGVIVPVKCSPSDAPGELLDDMERAGNVPVFIDVEHVEYLPVMDNRNRSIPADQVTSFDINKSIQRACCKAIARHGVGLFIYAGEDLPETVYVCENCKRDIVAARGMAPAAIASGTLKTYGRSLCMVCAADEKAKRAKAAEAVESMEAAGVPVEVS